MCLSETTVCVSFFFPVAAQLWAQLTVYAQYGTCMDSLMGFKKKSMMVCMLYNMTWVLWNERNLGVFQKKRTPVQMFLWKALES
jgi:hypothetical protein